MADQTSLGGPQDRFPSTRWSLLTLLEGPARQEALNELCRLYWKPVYAFVRASRGSGNEEAKDLTQEFFAELLEGRLLSRASPERGTFRAYLKGALRLFLAERHREASALKRGGGRRIVPLDDAEAARIATDRGGASEDEAFDREWAHALLERAVDDLRAELAAAGKDVYFRVFERHEIDPPESGPPGHARLAEEFGLRESDVNHYLAACRKALRRHVIERIRAYVAEDREIAEELLWIFAR